MSQIDKMAIENTKKVYRCVQFSIAVLDLLKMRYCCTSTDTSGGGQFGYRL